MIVVFGSLNVDMVMPVDHFPKPGETVLCAADYLSRTGGKGANQAVAAGRAGAKVAMVGKVGDDSFGRRSVNNLKTQSILTTGIGISERPTGCSTIAVDRAGANIVMTAPGANLDATSDQVPDEVFISKNIILAQLEAAPHETFSVLARAHARGTTTILNASPARALVTEVLKTVNYLIVNEIEALQLAVALNIRDSDPRLIAPQVAAAAAGLTCIITMEDKGCVAVRGREVWLQPALGVEVVDTTGAGDAFCGIFAACLQAEKTWLEALRFASAGASLSCLGLGAQAGMPFMEDIESALGRLDPARKMA
jgi:ribokinase